MTLASTSVHVVGGAHQMAATTCLYPQNDLQVSPDSLGGSPRTAGESDPGSFQVTTSALGSRACKIL